jgi:hypothetical protein
MTRPKRTPGYVSLHRRAIVAAALLVASLTLTACGGREDGDGATAAPTERAATSAPATPTPGAATQDAVGLLAIGHSGLTGINSDPERPDYDATENSWATGENPDVNSIYLRMLALRPETEGHVRNAAVSGSRANELADQAREGLLTVPAPALVIIQTIDNDIRCDGTDEARIPKFGEDIAEALGVITEASPNSRIFMVTTLDTMTPEFVTELSTAIPAFKTEFTGTGPCALFSPAGELVPEKIGAFAAIISAYNAELARVCGEVPQCRTDNGAGSRFVENASYWTDDGHPNVVGLAAWAETMWPLVEAVLTAP